MSADGGVWITDNTQHHNVFNGGEEDRVHPVAQFWIATCPYLSNLVKYFSQKILT